MSTQFSSAHEYSYKNSSANGGVNLADVDSGAFDSSERIESAFSNATDSTSFQLPDFPESSTPASHTEFVEYNTVGPNGEAIQGYTKKSTFTSSSTSTKSRAYGGSGGSLQLQGEITRESISPIPARSSSSMSKLNSSNLEIKHEHSDSCSHSHPEPVRRPASGSGGEKIAYVYRREETTRSSSGGGGEPRSTPSTTSRKNVKWSDQSKTDELIREINKDIDFLPDPDLDKEISLHTMEKSTTRSQRRIKADESERFDYNDFALIPPSASRSPLPARKTQVRDRSPSPTIDPRSPSPVHQLTVPPKYIEVRTPSPKDKIEQEHNCKYHSHHLDYKYTPPPVKGPCIACGQYIVGSLVTALDQMWHPECFTCVNCDTILKAHNYVVEDGKQYCKDCHLRLFGPPCSVCHKPTQSNRYNLLNRIWHPECFCCVECGKRLTPDNFIERLGSPYCKEDYHRLFSPKCCVCHLPIKDKAINALGKMWHPHCFKCTHCGIPLEERNFYERNGLPYCEKDYLNLFSPKCHGCKQPITDGRQMIAMGKPWHPECFRCTVCVKPLTPDNFMEKDGKPYCEKDYHNLFSPKCAGCKAPITDGNPVYNKGKPWHPECDAAFNRPAPPPVFEPELDVEQLLKPLQQAPPPPPPKPRGPPCYGCAEPIDDDDYITAMGRNYHPNCFKCTECANPLNPYNFYEKNGLPYCEDDYHKLFSPKCAGCKEPIKDNNYIRAMGKDWHPECFKCDKCRIPLSPDNFYEKNGKPYCEDDFHKLFSPKCCACNKPIKEKPIFALGKEWHPQCFRCAHPRCDRILDPNDFKSHDGKPYCKNHFDELFSPKCHKCHKPITGKMVTALGKNYHPECFQCTECHVPLSPDNFYEKNGKPYCENDFHKLFSPKCCACNLPIKQKPVFALGKEWHPHCFRCSHPRCDRVLDPEDFETHDGKPYCKYHFQEMFLPKCFACKKPITDKVVSALGKTWHPECFACVQCNQPLDLNAFREKDGLPYCEADYHALFSPKCAACEAPIIEKCLTALGKTWHPEHFTCQHCNKIMADDPEGYHEHDGMGYCRPCYIELFAPYCRGCNKPIVEKICVTALNSKYHPDCFVCRDCGCSLKEGNFFEFEGEPYCEEHYRCKMCPDCVKLRRAQNKYFGTLNGQTSSGGGQKVVVTNGVNSLPHKHHQHQQHSNTSIRLGA